MIHHWKGLDLEFTDFNYHHDPTPSVETIPSQISRYVVCGYFFYARRSRASHELRRGESRMANLDRAQQ